MHTDKAGHIMFGWEYVLVFAFEFTPIVTIVYKTLLKLRFVKLIFEEICFYRNAAILNAVLKHTECSNISFLIYKYKSLTSIEVSGFRAGNLLISHTLRHSLYALIN